MAYHSEDNTMDVIIGGCIQRRAVAYTERHVIERGPQGDRHFMNIYMPELLENEICNWTIGSDVPLIVRTKA